MDKQLLAISPIDGRYYEKTMELASFFSEYALIKYRIVVEIKYLIFLYNLGLKELSMGMSSDFENAVINGSTFLRLGTLIMGERNIT